MFNTSEACICALESMQNSAESRSCKWRLAETVWLVRVLFFKTLSSDSLVMHKSAHIVRTLTHRRDHMHTWNRNGWKNQNSPEVSTTICAGAKPTTETYQSDSSKQACTHTHTSHMHTNLTQEWQSPIWSFIVQFRSHFPEGKMIRMCSREGVRASGECMEIGWNIMDDGPSKRGWIVDYTHTYMRAHIHVHEHTSQDLPAVIFDKNVIRMIKLIVSATTRSWLPSRSTVLSLEKKVKSEWISQLL